MILGEQKYKNRNRIYYHGFQKDFDESKKLFDGFYLTTSKLYAAVYAKRDGFIKAYRLKDENKEYESKVAEAKKIVKEILELDDMAYTELRKRAERFVET